MIGHNQIDNLYRGRGGSKHDPSCNCRHCLIRRKKVKQRLAQILVKQGKGKPSRKALNAAREFYKP